MKPCIRCGKKWGWFNVGWFSGEPVCLFSIDILSGMYGGLTILNIRFIKFVIGFGI